jgi:hypothetical protein
VKISSSNSSRIPSCAYRDDLLPRLCTHRDPVWQRKTWWRPDAFAAEATKPGFTGLQEKTAGFRTHNLRHPCVERTALGNSGVALCARLRKSQQRNPENEPATRPPATLGSAVSLGRDPVLVRVLRLRLGAPPATLGPTVSLSRDPVFVTLLRFQLDGPPSMTLSALSRHTSSVRDGELFFFSC